MTELVPYIFEGELLDGYGGAAPECQIGYGHFCSNEDVQLVEDPYEADVNDNPGQMLWVCPECYQEMCDVI